MSRIGINEHQQSDSTAPQCVSCGTNGRQPSNDLTSPPMDLWQQRHDAEQTLDVSEGRNVGTSGIGALPLKLIYDGAARETTTTTKGAKDKVKILIVCNL